MPIKPWPPLGIRADPSSGRVPGRGPSSAMSTSSHSGWHAFLTRENRVLRYANPAAYPFYLLHQTVIVAVAYVVVRWDAAVFPRYVAIVLLSLGLTVALYELAVRRTNVTRVLFGLKPRPRSQVEPSIVVDRVAA
jgi:peptidoglycan/LPS O-acetylase OafA/YrhL